MRRLSYLHKAIESFLTRKDGTKLDVKHYIDDLLITGESSEEQHVDSVIELLSRLHEKGIKISPKNVSFSKIRSFS